MAAAALTGHRRVHGRRRETRAAPGGRPGGDALTETPIAHLQRLHHAARATQRGRAAEHCWARVMQAPPVKRKKLANDRCVLVRKSAILSY